MIVQVELIILIQIAGLLFTIMMKKKKVILLRDVKLRHRKEKLYEWTQ